MSLFRRTFSTLARRTPDHLLEISECIYVFDSCLSTATINENDFKSYLGAVVASLQKFHAGASFMVFNFREGNQISSLSDILIDYDMTVVDYPLNHEGYPLLPLEMINYFLRSSESWLSLPGQKNVILMHCEKGGWLVLAFMLAGLLLYIKQYSGEQKTLEMVYKYAPKQVFSFLSLINARASQLRYLKYITGRDLGSDWPPPDAPLVMNCLLLHNVPLFDGGKGCRPAVRVYGQDPLGKTDRGPRLLLSTLMGEEAPWQYPKEECLSVKLELRCQVQGDVFLECIHLYNDLVTEDLIFKVMFHTGFIQANVLAFNSGDIDVPWNAKYQLPKDFTAEILFRDINEVPPEHITMEFASGDDYHSSDNEFFGVEEILTPLPSSPEKNAGFKIEEILTPLPSNPEKKVDIKIEEIFTPLPSNPENKVDFTIEEIFTPLPSNPEKKADIKIEEIFTPLPSNPENKVDFKIEEIFTPLPSSPENKADIKIKEIITPLPSSHEDEVDFKIEEIFNLLPSSPEDEADIKIEKIFTPLPSSPENKADFKIEEIFTPLPSSPENKADFKIEEIFTPLPSSPENKADFKIKNRDCTLHNGSPRWELESEVSTLVDSIDRAFTKGNVEQASENLSHIKDIVVTEVTSLDKRNIDEVRPKQESVKETHEWSNLLAVGVDPIISSSKNTAIHYGDSKQVAEKAFDISELTTSGLESGAIASKNIVMVDDNKQPSETESVISTPTPGSESGTIASDNIVMVDDSIYKQASETVSVIITENSAGTESGTASKNILMGDDRIHKRASETESNIILSENIVMEADRIQEKASEIESIIIAPTSGSETGLFASNNIAIVEDIFQKQVSETESVIIAPTSGLESGIIASKTIVLVDDNIQEQASEIEPVIIAPTSGLEPGVIASRNITIVADNIQKQGLDTEPIISAPTSGSESNLIASENIVTMDDWIHEHASETESVIIAPTLGSESGLFSSKNIVMVNDRIHKQASEKESNTNAQPLGSESGLIASKNTAIVDDNIHKQASETKSDIHASENIAVVDNRNHKEASGTQSEAKADEVHHIQTSGIEFGTNGLKNIVLDDSNHIQAPETELDTSAPTSGVESGIMAAANIDPVDDMYQKPASETESGISASENLVVIDIRNPKDSETQFEVEAEFVPSELKNIVVDTSNLIQAPEKEMDVGAPISGAESSISVSRNIVLDDDIYHKKASKIESDIMVDIRSQKEVSEIQSEAKADKGHCTRASETEFVPSVLKDIVVDNSNHIQALKKEMNLSAPISEAVSGLNASKNTVTGDIKNQKEAPETQSDINATKVYVITVDRNPKQASDVKPEISASKNIIVVDDGNKIQDVKVDIPKFVPSSSKTKQNKRNKWQEMTAKTITQQRVVSQWVPRAKQPISEPEKPKATTYKWVPKGASTPTGEK